MVRRITAGLLLFLCLFAVATGIARIAFESEPWGVLITITIDDLRIVASSSATELEEILSDLQTQGLGALLIEPTEDRELVQILKNVGMKAILEFRSPVETETLSRISHLFEEVSLATLPKYPFAGSTENLEFLAAETASSGKHLVLDEFQVPQSLRLLYDSSLHRLVRAHSMKSEERYETSEQETTQRFVRAIAERKIQILILPVLSFEQLEGDLAGLVAALEERDIELNQVDALNSRGDFYVPIVSVLPPILIQLVAFLIAVGAPVAGYLFLRKRCTKAEGLGGGVLWLLGFSAISLAGGLLASALMSQSAFLNGVASFRGVKVAMITPLLIIAVLALREIDLSPSRFTHVATLGIVGILFALLLIRSGNDSILPVPLIEEQVRYLLEQALVARPRFKEFLIGHPALFIWGALGSCRGRPWAIAILLLGIIGQVSIMNSFVHVHTPLLITLLRVFNGLWLGALLGVGIHYAIKIGQRFLSSRSLELSRT